MTTTGPDRPALQMLRPDLDGLPSLERALAALPAGYALRTYRQGDEAAWAAIMNTGSMGTWDVDRTVREVTGRPYPQFDPDGLFFVTHHVDGSGFSTPVGSACTWLLDPDERELGVVHMVCVLPDHRGRRLSYPLCLAVLHRMRERHLRRARLSTHEWRLGAVKVYLDLGFRPLFQHELHPTQWAEVARALRWPEPLVPVADARRGS